MLMVTLLLPWVGDVFSHHSHANLNKDDIRTNTGTVVRYIWRMPHVYIVIKAPNQRGEMVDHTVEMLHPPAMLQRGWKKDSFKPGDKIIWNGAADKNPNRYYSGIKWAETADGTRLDLELKDSSNKASADFVGLWSRDLRGKPGHYKPPEGWPYTDLAQEAVDSFSDLKNPMLECQYPGPPKSTLLPYPIKISRPSDKVLELEYEGRKKSRTIFLDDNGPGPGERSPQGYSTGHFEGDVLVVKTDNFSPDRWGIHTGVDSSEQKKLTERFSLIDDGFAIAIEMVVEDPVYLTEPVKIEHFLRKIKDRELVTVPCTLENATLFIDSAKAKNRKSKDN
jgi:hypothetical protein